MRLSKLEKYILRALYFQHVMAGMDESDPDNTITPINRSDLFDAVQGYWKPGTSKASRQASFSRSTHRMVEKGLLIGWALAWYIKTHDIEEHYHWQGGGRPKTREENSKFDQPVYRMFALDDEGLKIAAQLRGREVEITTNVLNRWVAGKMGMHHLTVRNLLDNQD